MIGRRVTLLTQPRAWVRFVAGPYLLSLVRKPWCWSGSHHWEEWFTFPFGVRDRTVRRCTTRCRDCGLRKPSTDD